MEFPPRLDSGSPLLRPRLAMLAALLDDWALPFGERRGRRGSGLTFPKWMITDDFDDDRPVLRRSRSTWATWPSSSAEDDEDVQEDGGEGSLVPWWSRRTVRSRPRSWAPGRPRTQDELREARRRYFEPQHRRESEDEPATHRSPQRVAFEEFRDVPIRSGAARRSSPPTRTSHLREVPVTRERPGREVPDLKDDRVSTDVPATRDVPVSRDGAASRDVPVSRNIPISREAPANKEAHARKDIPLTRELPASRDIPVTRDFTAMGNAPVSRDIPVTRDFTAVGTAPVSRDIPVTRDFTAVGTAPISRDVPVTRDFTAVGTAPVSRDVPAADTPPARVRNIPVEREVSETTPSQPGPRPGQGGAGRDGEGGDWSAGSVKSELRDVRGPEDMMVPTSVLEDERRRALQLQEENLRLKAVINTIQETNKRWQDFNAARQAYIQRLLSTIEEQQQQLNACLDALKTSSPHRPPAPAAAPGPAATLPPTTTTSPTSDAEARLRRLQREVGDLQQRLLEARREHRDAISMLQTVPPPPATPATPATAPAEQPSRGSTATSSNRAEFVLREIARKLAGGESPDCGCQCSASSSCDQQAPPPSRPQPGRELWSSPPSSPRSASPCLSSLTDSPPRTTYHDLVTDGAPPPQVGRPRTPSTQYSFDGQSLRMQHDGPRRAASPALSDALTPTPASPPPGHQPAYPVELSGSCSSVGSTSGPAPHIDVPSSSRATTPDADMSMCSDATLDCSPPSPVQNVADARGRSDPFRWIERGVGLRLF